MKDLCPYFTNDGTVGLFSNKVDDIYHSTYGALTESWQKFIEPANLEEYIKSHNEVKILDVCYGIGYNTKAALQTFLNVTKKNKKVPKKYKNKTTNIAQIHTDNILGKKNKNFEEKNSQNVQNINRKSEMDEISSEAIYTDNINSDQQKKIFIDAVDVDEKLITISPFISLGCENKSVFFKKITNNNYVPYGNDKQSIQNALQCNNFNPLGKKYKLSRSIPILILQSLIKNSATFNETILKEIYTQDAYSHFLSKYMLNFLKFYQNLIYKTNQKKNKSTFLHNIYYRYISRSYKTAEKLLQNGTIQVNLHNNDARKLVKSTNTKYNFIFLDAFTPAKCPALWTLEFFEELFNKLEDDGMILTYSSSVAVRNALLQNGFHVGKTFDIDLNKFVGTVATKNIDLIKYPLDEKDLALINSKAGICYKDENLNLDNTTIIMNREKEVGESALISSSKALKGINA